MEFIIILFIIYVVCQFPSMFQQWSNMDYVKHLEDMGVFVDKDGKEI